LIDIPLTEPSPVTAKTMFSIPWNYPTHTKTINIISAFFTQVMMQMDIKLLFEYNWYCRRKFVEYWKKLSWDIVVEDFGASFGSMRDIFVHSLEAEQGWLRTLSNFTSGKNKKWPSHNYDVEFIDIEALEKYMDEVEMESQEYLKELTHTDLDKIYSGVQVPVRVEDVLMHVVEEEIHHRGELLCIMWQNDLEPPHQDWFDWLKETDIKTK
jgi:uncharacterized damage-inducible protein DinB